MPGLMGKKIGMSQVFDADGALVPVTVVEAGPCVVVRVKTTASDGYNALQLGFGDRAEKAVNKPEAGHLKQVGRNFRRLFELRVDDPESYEVGQELKLAELFAEGDYIDVTGTSKGRGFPGRDEAAQLCRTSCNARHPRVLSWRRWYWRLRVPRPCFGRASAWPARWATSAARSRA